MDRLLGRAAIALVRLYRRLAPQRLRLACRFTPTCSAYALEAFARHGFARGLRLVVNRLLRCRPPYGGEDPVP